MENDQATSYRTPADANVSQVDKKEKFNNKESKPIMKILTQQVTQTGPYDDDDVICTDKVDQKFDPK